MARTAGWSTSSIATRWSRPSCPALRDPTRGRAMREAARATAVQRFDLRTRCLPAALKLIRSLAVSGVAQAPRARR